MSETKKWILFSTIVVAISGSILLFTQPNIVPSYKPHLLTLMSSALAATFSLVFTITLVYVQISSGYSPYLLDWLFITPVKVYMVLFILSIVFPLVVMLLIVNNYIVYLSIILTIACYAVLLPYFMYMKSLLNIDILLNKISRNTLKRLKKKKRVFLGSIVEAIYNIASRALDVNDYYSYESCLETLELLFKASHDRESRNSIVMTLRYIRANVMGDTFASIKVMGTIKSLGKFCIESGLSEDEAVQVIEPLEFVAWKATDLEEFHIVKEISDCLDELIHLAASLSPKKTLPSRIAKWFVISGAYGQQCNIEYIQRLMALCLAEHVKSKRIEFSQTLTEALNEKRRNPKWVLQEKEIAKFEKFFLQQYKGTRMVKEIESSN